MKFCSSSWIGVSVMRLDLLDLRSAGRFGFAEPLCALNERRDTDPTARRPFEWHHRCSRVPSTAEFTTRAAKTATRVFSRCHCSDRAANAASGETPRTAIKMPLACSMVARVLIATRRPAVSCFASSVCHEFHTAASTAVTNSFTRTSSMSLKPSPSKLYMFRDPACSKSTASGADK